MLMRTSSVLARGENVKNKTVIAQLCQIVCSVVEFKTRDDMERAIRKLDGTELNGRKISLIEVCR